MTIQLYSPLEQFEVFIIQVINIIGFDIYITNMTISLFLVSFFIYMLFVNFVKNGTLIPHKGQRLAEILYIFMNNLVKQQAGIKGLKYFPILLLLFYFIFFFNVIGLIPFGFTNTSQIVYTFTLGFSMFIGVTIVGLVVYKWKFFNRFVPDITGPILPLIVVIEIFSYLVRPFSLSIRLFANMVAGHTLLHILGGFASGLAKTGLLYGMIMGIPLIAVCGLEFGISFLQAYVFVVLVCIYLKESLYGH
jgi:F-type H+-transporting ATPase subunit a